MEDEAVLKWVGKKIRQGRLQKNISLQALATLCEMDKANLSRIEAGKTNITLTTLNKIAQKLYGGLSSMFCEEA